jgi:hypothetical protein
VHVTVEGAEWGLKIPKHLIVRVECWAYVSLSIAGLEADNSSVIANCDNGKMPLPARFKTAQPGKNCDRYGWRSNTITSSTKNSTPMNITRFCANLDKTLGNTWKEPDLDLLLPP